MKERDKMIGTIKSKYIAPDNHRESDYFGAISELVFLRESYPEDREIFQQAIESVYALIEQEIISSQEKPGSVVKFGTSGWRGIIGKDLTGKSVSQVAQAIVDMYKQLDHNSELSRILGVAHLQEAADRGCVVGHDNRFGGAVFAEAVADVLTSNGFKVYYAGETTTGVISAAILELNAAFSCNLTPSHNPLQYGGFKFNAADAGPAAPEVTNVIQERARTIIETDLPVKKGMDRALIEPVSSLDCWKSLVRRNKSVHHLDYDSIIDEFAKRSDVVVAVDCVHGGSRIHVTSLFGDFSTGRLIVLRGWNDPTFGGIAPEPSDRNMAGVNETLRSRSERLKLGVMMDPDADRIRFTDGSASIEMNQFGALAYHYLHEIKGVKGMVAKTVATSNFANVIADRLGEEVFEPKVGFKEFKPVIGKAVVCFEESDGITIKGHTPEKDAYIGLLLALSMTLGMNKNLGEYLGEVQRQFGHFYSGRDAVTVSQKGPQLLAGLKPLGNHVPGTKIQMGKNERTIRQLITVDGYKMVFDDGSWLLIRPSGTEPKVRFYVEACSEEGKKELFEIARGLLKGVGLL